MRETTTTTTVTTVRRKLVNVPKAKPRLVKRVRKIVIHTPVAIGRPEKVLRTAEGRPVVVSTSVRRANALPAPREIIVVPASDFSVRTTKRSGR